ncbi:hypothetical protein BaRGS_00031628, partial [Batillaria attramentaria]
MGTVPKFRRFKPCLGHVDTAWDDIMREVPVQGGEYTAGAYGERRAHLGTPVKA